MGVENAQEVQEIQIPQELQELLRGFKIEGQKSEVYIDEEANEYVKLANIGVQDFEYVYRCSVEVWAAWWVKGALYRANVEYDQALEAALRDMWRERYRDMRCVRARWYLGTQEALELLRRLLFRRLLKQ